MKKESLIKVISIIIGIAVFLTLKSCFSSITSGGVSGTNVVNLEVEDSRVYYNMKCPSCGYVDPAGLSCKVDEGETYDNRGLCRECGKVYPFTITRR